MQFVLIGAMAGDDPEGWEIWIGWKRKPRTILICLCSQTCPAWGSMEVNAFQRSSDGVIQKSLREGFGLVVSEALWKEKAGGCRQHGRHSDAVSEPSTRISS